MHGLYWLAVELASRTPLLLVVDDAHWADAASLRWLAYLARRLSGVSASVVIAARDAEPGTDAGLLERAHRSPRELPPPGLLSVTPSPLAAARLPAARSGVHGPVLEGHGREPVPAAEVTAELATQGLDPDAMAPRDRGGRAPDDRTLGAHPGRAARPGRRGGRRSGRRPLRRRAHGSRRRAGGPPVPEAANVVDRLAAARILRSEPVAFAHPVLPTAVYEQLPRCAEGSRTRAPPLAAAGTVRARRETPAALPRPATRPCECSATPAVAAARGAPDSAVRLLRRALDEPPHDRTPS